MFLFFFKPEARCLPSSVSSQLEQKQKYAAWKAADIRKALSEGRRPSAGPPAAEYVDSSSASEAPETLPASSSAGLPAAPPTLAAPSPRSGLSTARSNGQPSDPGSSSFSAGAAYGSSGGSYGGGAAGSYGGLAAPSFPATSPIDSSFSSSSAAAADASTAGAGQYPSVGLPATTAPSSTAGNAAAYGIVGLPAPPSFKFPSMDSLSAHAPSASGPATTAAGGEW